MTKTARNYYLDTFRCSWWCLANTDTIFFCGVRLPRKLRDLRDTKWRLITRLRLYRLGCNETHCIIITPSSTRTQIVIVLFRVLSENKIDMFINIHIRVENLITHNYTLFVRFLGFRGLFNAKAIIVEEQLWHYLGFQFLMAYQPLRIIWCQSHHCRRTVVALFRVPIFNGLSTFTDYLMPKPQL